MGDRTGKNATLQYSQYRIIFKFSDDPGTERQWQCRYNGSINQCNAPQNHHGNVNAVDLSSNSVGVCIPKEGCSSGVTSNEQYFMDAPVSSTGTTGSGIPVLSVHQLSDKSWVGTLSKLGSTNPGDATSIQMEKNNVDLDQPVYFSIVSSNWGSDPGANLLLAAKANLTRLDSNLHYTITGTTSVPVPGMDITPKIWQKNETGDVLVYTGAPVTCSGSTTCVATGNFTPSDDASYFANATVLYTGPTALTGAAGTQRYGIATASAVTASGTTYYYVFADGVGLYTDGNTDLYWGNKTPIYFYNNIVGKQGTVYSTKSWKGIGDPVDYATGSRNWNKNYDANSMANNADFALHAGHGWDNGVKFNNANYSADLLSSDMSFGGNNGKAKWVAFFSCNVLKQSTKDNWKSVFNGLHILMGFDTVGLLGRDQGPQFAKRMTGSDIYDETKIRDAWRLTLKDTIDNSEYWGAYMWADPSGEDYLPGFGSFSEPTKDNTGQYTIHYEHFDCSKTSQW